MTPVDYTTPTTTQVNEDAAICSECTYTDIDKGAVERAFEHVRNTGHAMQAEHRERIVWKWSR